MAVPPRLRRAAHPLLLLLILALPGCPGGSQEPARDSDADIDAILAHAEGSFRAGEYGEARAAYEKVLQARPDDPRVMAPLGTCYLKTHQVKTAGELLAGHLKSHPENTAARLVLARALIRQAEFDAAATQLQQVLKADPNSLMAQYNLGFLAYRRHDYEGAVEHLKATLALRPDHPEAHYTLGLTYMAQERYPEAVAELQEAVRIDPKHVGARYNLANAAARTGNTALAAQNRAVYAELSGRTKADAERANQVKSSSLKAVEFLMAEKYPEALAEYQKLLAQHPDYAPLYNDVGRLQLKLGQRQEALATLKRAVEIDPRLSEPHYLLANIYREMGDAAAADRELGAFAALETIPEGKSGY